MKQNRSGIDIDTIDEQIRAEDSAKWSTLQNTQQYYTPVWLAEKIERMLRGHSCLPDGYNDSIIDPQCGNGNLLRIGKQETFHRCRVRGADIDKRDIDQPFKVSKVVCDTVKLANLLETVYKSTQEYDYESGYKLFRAVYCNPPFAKRWKVGDEVIDSSAAINDAIAQGEEQACPITQPTEFMLTAYADEEEQLECVDPMGFDLTAGKSYPVSTCTYNFIQKFTRTKTHYNGEDDEMYSKEHECAISGQDRQVMISDDRGKKLVFKRHTREHVQWEVDDSMLFKVFKKPDIKSLAERFKDKYDMNMHLLSTCETMAGFEYYPGQKDYLARVGIKDYGQIAAAVGTGKSLMAISLIAMKAPKRTLICAPRGTIKGEDGEEQEYNPSQWVSEICKFAPFLRVFELFSMEDYHRIMRQNKGKLPIGVYITYYEALTYNQSMESCPSSWDDKKLHHECCRLIGISDKDEKYAIPEPPDGDPAYWAKRVGESRSGIRCIMTPNMATQIGHWFDAVILDENHYACNLDSLRTQALIRLQPKFRYGLSATPIPNRVDNMFSLMGWLCVPDWYKGDRRNAAWPYSKDELARFQSTFLTKERDFTRENDKRRENPWYKGKCESISPVIASPARLLKLISPTLSFIDKKTCNPDLVPCTVRDVRVELGKQQAQLYAHFLQRSNIPGTNPLVIARKQSAYLRGICADPMGFDNAKRGGPTVESNMNPKILATLKLVLEMHARGEQCVIVSSRVGISNTMANLLQQAGLTYSRIDSTVPPDNHSTQSNWFKDKKTDVMLMGIKCAVGYSFPACPNMVITSLEWSYGTKEQAEGRVFRVNSLSPVNIWCILHANTIEELMFDKVATKKDAATICLHGERIPVDFKPIDMNELISQAGDMFNIKTSRDELEVEQEILQVLADHKKKEIAA